MSEQTPRPGEGRVSHPPLAAAAAAAIQPAPGDHDSQGAPRGATTTPRVPRAPADYKWAQAAAARQLAAPGATRRRAAGGPAGAR